jgi:hypothetical protein
VGYLDTIGGGHGNHRHVGSAAFSGINPWYVTITNMVAMHVTDKNNIDLAQPGIIRTRYRSTCIIKQARSIWVFQ